MRGEAPVRMAPGRAWSAVMLLTLVGVVNIVDRALPGVLVEPIKHDLQLSDTAIGLINGFGFLLVYSLLGIPIARLSDRGAYGLVISSCLGLWSVMTLIGAAAQTGWQLALTRMGVALGEAGSTPGAHAFVARNFAPDRRAAALAVLTLSIPLSHLLSYLGGGLLGAAFGWRATFAFMGIFGLVLGPLVLLLLGRRQPPVAGVAPPVASRSLKPAFGLLRKPSFLLIMIATAFIGIGGYALNVFASAFLMRVHGLTLAQVSVQYGIAAGAAGIVSVLGAGIVADRLSRSDPRWILWVLTAMVALLAPCSFAAFRVAGAREAVLLLALGNVVGVAYLPPAIAAIQRLAPPDTRATASAFLLMFTAIAGGLGPLIAGQISDALEAELGPRALAVAMLVVPLTHMIAGLFYFLASLGFRHDMLAVE
ncbi:spinster family MFS transporter [Sphingobium tyrosinilyticum]|uniref:Spinster family MFS transporter n=1 Tax=Sphingobium tyrosinilyticum TaxID=2715436 RepID=A0ABV9F1R4_9SPHN